MAITLEPVADGWRAMDGSIMVAHIQCKDRDPKEKPKPMTHQDRIHPVHNVPEITHPTIYHARPRGLASVRLANGDATVTQLEEILKLLK
jgi:hypothetical protein